MSLADLIRAAILASIMLIVLGLGLRSTWQDLTSLFRHPGLLLRSLLAMNVLMPVLAALLVMAIGPSPPVKIALVALAVAPVPPFLPGKQLKLVSSEAYVMALLGAGSLLAVVLGPLTFALIGAISSHRVGAAPLAVARVVAMTVLIPLLAGVGIRRLAPGLAARMSPLAGKIGMLLLIVAFVPVLITSWSAMISLIGDGTLLAIIVFVLIGLAIGHALGGPDPDNRSVLALATASRHPGVAMAIATASFPEQKLVPAAILLYLLVSAVASAPYTTWRRRLHARALAH